MTVIPERRPAASQSGARRRDARLAGACARVAAVVAVPAVLLALLGASRTPTLVEHARAGGPVWPLAVFVGGVQLLMIGSWVGGAMLERHRGDAVALLWTCPAALALWLLVSGVPIWSPALVPLAAATGAALLAAVAARPSEADRIRPPR